MESSVEKYHRLKSWIGWLETMSREFPGNNVSIGTAIKSFKSQLKFADRLNAKYVCIIGEDELKNNKCIIRNMSDGTQVDCNLYIDEIVKSIEK